MTGASTAVVVGGGSGIGAAVAAAHRARGDEVLVWDRRDGTDDADGVDIRCDVTDPAAIDAATAATIERIGVPDLVTITAGIGHAGALLDAPADEWDRVVGTNAKGAWLAMRALARPMLEAGRDGAGDGGRGRGRGGSIVATSSVSGGLADRTMGLYCASKAALDMVIKVAAQEWAPGVRVNGVAPGVTDTPMLGPVPRDRGWLRGVADRTALGRLGTADDIAETILALHHMRWVTGQIVPADGGLSRHSPINPTGR